MTQATITIHYTEALALIQEIQAKKDTLDMEMVDWIDWSEEVIGMLCDMFDIEEPVEGKNVLKRAEAIKEVKDLRVKLAKLGNSPDDILIYGVLQGGIGTLCRLFNIKDEEVNG